MLSLSDGPAVEPVTLAEVKAHLRIDTHTDEDAYLSNFVIPTARRHAEHITQRAFIDQTWILRLLSFGSAPIVLPRPPLSSITSVQYVDNDGDTQTWAAGDYDIEQPTGEFALWGSLRPGYSLTYPTTRSVVDAVTVTFVAGYGAAASDVPVGVKHGIFVLAADLYNQRGSQLAEGVGPEAMVSAQNVLSHYLAKRWDLRYD